MKKLPACILALCATAIAQTPNPNRVAVVNGEQITIQEVEKAAAPEMRAIDVRRAQVEIELERDRKLALDNALEEIVKDRLLAAEASLCAYEQDKFWQFHDAMFSDQQNLTVEDLKQKAAKLSMDASAFNTCLDSGKYIAEIQSDMEEGVRVGISGTPALFINGRLLIGAQPHADIQKIIEDELRRSSAA